MDVERLRDKCDRLQWSVDDIDWDAPGADRVSPQQADNLREFMSNLFWIETIAAVVFDGMATRTSDPTRYAIFRSFAIDEQRHADAERMLMERWGILKPGERPVPNVNVANLLRSLESMAHKVHPSVFSAIVPMTELVLDGALVKYLTRSVDDPVCGQVFDKINADEARHLAMDFYMLEHYGKSYSVVSNTLDLLRSFARPQALYAMFFGYFPMLARSGQSLDRAGFDLVEIRKAMHRYVDLGRKNPDIARHPTYRIMSSYVQMVTAGHDQFGRALVVLSDAVDGVKSRRAA